MALQNTNLLIQASHLPPTFKGKPDELFQAMVERMKIVSPTGTSFFVVSDLMPSSNQGPWLKGGTQWWVWDEELKTYVPLDISESETRWFQVGNTIPTSTVPPVWLKTTEDQTEASPLPGDPIGWYLFNGTTWVPFTELFDRSIEPIKLADKPVASLISFDEAGHAEIISGGTPGQFPRVKADGTGLEFANSAVAPGTINGLVGTSKNLVIKNQPGDEDTILDITADSVILQSNSGDYTVAVNVVDLVDITVMGIGGLDTGSETADTWYYVWLISNGASNGTLLSTSSSTPVLPSGYTFKALLGAVRNDSSSNLVRIRQKDRKIFMVTESVAYGAASDGAWTARTVPATSVPPLAKTVFGDANVLDNGLSLGFFSPDNVLPETSAVAVLDANHVGYFEFPLDSSQTLYQSGTGNLTVRYYGFTI